MNYKEKFDKAIEYIKRDGVQELVNWLEKETDFFTSPASTKYHGNHDGGLLEHSINVLEYALNIFNFLVKRRPELDYLKESVIISSLFHDVCKANCYVQEEKWTKNSSGKWVNYLGYTFDDKFPLGHGEKSVYLISKFVNLTDTEVLAIRWHMGSYEVGNVVDGSQKWAYSAASDHPLVRLIHAADLMATTLEHTIDYQAIASK